MRGSLSISLNQNNPVNDQERPDPIFKIGISEDEESKRTAKGLDYEQTGSMSRDYP